MSRKKKRGRTQSTRDVSSFMTRGITDINNEIKQTYGKVVGLDKLWKTYTKITKVDAEACFERYHGRCVFCNKALKYLGRMSKDAARLMFYVPLNVGGEARPDNLVVVCAYCKYNHRSVKPREADVVGVDSFADLCEALFLAIRDGSDEDHRDAIKNRLNLRLADIATCMRYVTKGDWIPDAFDKVVDGENTIGERLEHMGRGEDVKDDITNAVKQIITTKQYKIIRPGD